MILKFLLSDAQPEDVTCGIRLPQLFFSLHSDKSATTGEYDDLHNDVEVCPEKYLDKDTMNCPGKAMKISYLNQTK